MSAEIQELPEQGEIVLATITKIMDHGAYVSLDEFDGIQGFLHISEIAPGWIRSVGKFVREGEKKVLLVKSVKPDRGDIDLSLKQVSNDQKKRKLLEVKKFEKGKTLLQNVKEKAKLSDKELEELEESLYSKYDSMYDGFLEIAKKGNAAIKELKLSKKIVSAIEDVCTKIKLPSVQIRGILELSCNNSDGVEVIKKILLDVIKNNSNVDVAYLGAPKYRLTINSEDFKSAEKSLQPILNEIERNIEKQKGIYKFTREESKKTREG